MIGVFNASEYPNVAAAKLASMYNCPLHNLMDLFTPEYDTVFLSAIFSWEADKVRDWAWLRRIESKVIIGGPGWNEATYEDIEDYPLEGFSHSYTSVGCIRDCPWCIVPRQYPDGIRELEDWGYAPVMLDANILATSDKHRAKVIKKLAGRRVEWNSGIDTRLVDLNNANFVAETSTPMMFLSWDSGEDSEPLEKALENLRAVGINPRNQVKVYVLTGYEGGWESGYQRAAKIKELGSTPFIMLYQPLWSERIEYPQVYKDLARWCNRAPLLWSMDFSEYGRDKAERARIREALK